MFEQNSKSRLMFFIALVIGSIGACGQAYLLHHELADCLPYKVIDYYFYQNIANVGVWVAPLIAVIIGLMFGLKRFWLSLLIPVILCPLVFSGIFKIASLTREVSGGIVAEGTSDFLNPEVAARNFYSYTLSLTITGLIIGAICIFLLSRISKTGKPVLP